MKTKTKHTKLIGIFVMALMFLIAITTLGVGTTTQVHAATSTSANYTTYGSYDIGNGSVSGYMDKYKIFMHSASQNGSTGTIYNNKVLNWTYTYIKIDVTDIKSHTSFKLTRNGSTYISKSLSGNGDMTLYSGSLPDGEYVLTYVGVHNTTLWFTKTYTYTYKFVIDKTAPNYTLKAGTSSISSGSYTNQQITYSVSDYKTYCIYYKKPGYSSYNVTYNDSYTVAATSANNGWWYFYAEDYYNNTNSSVSIYLDTVKPVGKVTNANGVTIANGGYTNKAIQYTATDTGGVSYYQYKAPNSSSWTSYSAGTSLSGNYGWYYFRAVDKAGNVSDEYKVYYDAGIPSGTLYGGTTLKSSGSYVNASYIKYVTTDSYSGIQNCYVKMPNSSYFTNYASGTQLATEGTYYFYAADKAGNTTATVSITLDRTKPTGTLYGGSSIVNTGGATNATYIKFVPYDAIGLAATYVKKPGATSYVSYSSGTQFTAEGTYAFYVVDKAGNTSQTYQITIDRKLPTAQLYVDENPIDNNGYTNGAHIKFECEERCFVKLPDTNTFVSYTSGTEFYKPGKYVFYGVDSAGNNTGYYTIIIDRTVKTLELNGVTNGSTNGDVVLDWTNGDADVFAPIKSVTINDKAYIKGQTIYTIDTGIYKVRVEDAAGNVWTTEFTSTKQNVLTKTFQKEYYEASDKDGNHFTFSSYDSAFAFAVNREKGFVRTGQWHNASWDAGIAMDAKDSVNAANGTYFIYKKSGNPNEEVAYFTEARLNEVIAEYAKVGIEDYFYWEKEPAPIADGENLYTYSDDKTILADFIQLGSNTGYTIDGMEFVGIVYDAEGRHTLIVTDEWGNSCDYDLTVVRADSTIHYAVGDGENNTVTFDRTYYFKDEVTVSISDEYDEFAMFNVYDENRNLIGNFHLGDTFTLKESGSYTVEAVNHYGVSETFHLVISKDTPKIDISENENGKKLEIDVSASIDDESHIQTLEIYKSTDNGETWELLEKDDYGNSISLDKLSYEFRTSGLYKVVVTDEFRTGIDAITKEFNYVQANPEGKLNGVENGGYTNSSVSFEWTDEAIVMVEQDGEIIEYTSGKVLTENGRYVITFENYDGYKAVYTFTIDAVEPEVTVEGTKNGETVNGDVKVFFTEENLTAEFFKDGVSLGEYQSGKSLTESGNYEIVVTDLARNETKVSFTIDKFVDFESNVNDKGLSNSVTITANEDVHYTLTKDSEEIAYTLGDKLTAPGIYILTLKDEYGNTIEHTFTIVDDLVPSFEHNFDDTPNFEKVLVNGEETRLNYGTLELQEDGVYEVSVIIDSKAYTFTIEVDGTAPNVAISGVENNGSTKGTVVISEISEPVDMKVYRDGVEIEYNIGDELSEIGQYKIVLTDECGNVTEYNFEILYSMNGGAIALIVIGALALVGVVVFIVLKKRRIFKK